MVISNKTDGISSSSLSDEGHMASGSETDGQSPCIFGAMKDIQFGHYKHLLRQKNSLPVL
jgi:hypothetical protein